jgi:DNA-directed RNA polymerase specialized sigma24 family protein
MQTDQPVAHYYSGGIGRMSFTAHDLRYHAEESFPQLYAYLQRYARRFSGTANVDTYELDLVVEHVVEQLVRLGVIGGGDHLPLTAIDSLSEAQFMAFLQRSVHNKFIDLWRKRHLSVSNLSELESPEGAEGEDNPLSDVIKPVWGAPPFATPEEITLTLASQQELRNLLKHCILALRAAPRQLQAILQEIKEFDCAELLRSVLDELHLALPPQEEPLEHLSQHKDHAHRKLRHCLQQQSTNLTVTIALRLTEYGVHDPATGTFEVSIDMLAQDDLSADEVCQGLSALVAEGLLDWHGEQTVRLSAAQRKRLSRYYRDE